MTEETGPANIGNGKTSWLFAIHHIIPHEIFGIDGARESFARLGIFEESRGNKVALLTDPMSVIIINAMPQSVRDVLDRNGFGFDVHPATNFHRDFNAFLAEEVRDIQTTPDATAAQKDAAMKLVFELSYDVAKGRIPGVALADGSFDPSTAETEFSKIRINDLAGFERGPTNDPILQNTYDLIDRPFNADRSALVDTTDPNARAENNNDLRISQTRDFTQSLFNLGAISEESYRTRMETLRIAEAEPNGTTPSRILRQNQPNGMPNLLNFVG